MKFQLLPTILFITNLSGDAITGAKVGDQIVITGQEFNEFSEQNRVSFNGTLGLVSQIQIGLRLDGEREPDRATVTVPPGATNGPLSLFNPSLQSNSLEFEIFQNPVIDVVCPDRGFPDAFVLLTGSNYDPSPLGNRIRFGSTPAQVLLANEVTLVTKVPANANTYSVTVISRSLPSEGRTLTVLSRAGVI